MGGCLLSESETTKRRPPPPSNLDGTGGKKQ